MKNLSLPLSREDARSLELGEMVTVSGMIFTGRSRFHIRAAEQNLFPPLDYGKINCFFHVGPVMKPENGGWSVVSCEPTSSIRFERYGADVIRKFRLRTRPFARAGKRSATTTPNAARQGGRSCSNVFCPIVYSIGR